MSLLLDAARRLFGERGYDGVSVTEIGRLAGVSHTLINTYFGGKAGLLYALVEDNNAPQLVATEEVIRRPLPAAERIRDALRVWAETELGDPRVYQVLQAYSWTWSDETEAKNRAERQCFQRLLEQVVAEGRQDGSIPDGARGEVISEALVALYTWGMREAVFRKLAPADAIDRIWPQVEALLGLSRPWTGADTGRQAPPPG